MSDASDSSKELYPCANPECGRLMSRDYICIGCSQPVHWFCAVGIQAENFLRGHGAHYCCPPCFSSGITPTIPCVQDGGTHRAGSHNNQKVQYLMMSDRMRFGSISSPQRWTVRESMAFLENNALDDVNDVDDDAATTVDDVKNCATAEEDADDEEENEPTLPMMSGSDSVDDVKNCATAEEDADDEEENEPTPPIHADATEVTTLTSNKEAAEPRMMTGSASSNGLLPCANPNCARLMSRDYLCIGCGQPVHWFCAAGNPADNEKGHGSHYWCPPCNLKKINTSTALLVSNAKPRRARNKPVATSKQHKGTSKPRRVAKKAIPAVPVDMGDCVTLPSLPPDIADSITETNTVCPSTLKFPPPSTGKSNKPSGKGRRQKSSARGAALASGHSDEFVGKLVAFFLDSPYGKELKSSFGRKWSDEAISYLANKEHGHLVGTVMRKVVQRKRKSTDGGSEVYEVAWEYTSLGESIVEDSYLSSAVIVGCHIESIRQPVSSSGGKKSIGRPKAKNRSEVLRRAVSGLNGNFSDDECVGHAPLSDNESVRSIDDDNELSSSMEDEHLEDEEDDFLEWMIFGKNNEDTNNITVVDPDCEDPSNGAINDVATEDHGGMIEGLHWNTSFNIDEPPAGRKPTKGCSVKTQYQYLFKSPIDSFFAIIPYIFWEIFC